MNNFYKILFENSLSGIGIVTSDGDIIDCNPALLKILGFSSLKEFQKYNIKDFYVDFNERVNFVNELNDKGFVAEKKLHIKTNKNKIITALVNAKNIQLNNEDVIAVNFVEISKQEQFEKDLIESERYLDLILNSVNAGVFLINPETHRVVDTNIFALKMLSYTKEEVIGKECHEFICPKERGKCPMTDFNNQIDNDIKQLITKSGDCRYILKSVRPIEIKGKTYLLETFTDINKQVRIEEELNKLNIELETKVKERTKELQKNETKYKSLIENLRHEYFFYRHNTEGVFEYVSPSIEYILGYQPEDFLMHYAKYLTDNPINQEAIERAELSMQGIQQLPYELEIYDIQKNIHTLEVSETPIVDSEGNVISVEGIVRDITSQKKAEELINKQLKEIQLNNEEIKSVNEEIHSVNDDLQNRLDDIRELNEYLKISEDKFRTLVRNIPGVVYRCLNDEHWTMQFISAEIETFSGYPASAFINNKVRSFASIIHHDDQRKVAESGYNLNKKNKSFVLEYRIIHANGSIMWVYDRGHYIFKDNSDEIQYLDGVIIDITEKKRAEEKLKESESQLQITNAQKDKFFSLLAHDLRSPIGNFLQISELLKTSYESLTPDQITDFFDNLYSLSDVTFKLLENLLMWSRSQLGRLETHPEDINLFEIVVNVGELYEENLKRKDIKLRNEIPLDLIVQTDLNFIQTIFRNLISNAIKFSYTGGSITIQTNIKEETYNDGESILISVKDKGIGIPKDVIDIIFDIDTDYSTMGTASEKGTGLGLILCKELVEKNGGKIWVESDEDNGSAFYFTLKC